ncbi:hypothetical protein [Streptomyces scabiei]|uniref:hypothetical protein n=1 Tax=Streptomyces scabiei TaxID=1930 RepID=UPI000765A8A5|nr:hypothetical protein [Streptomyces scabiei]MDX2998148.1 hypothetical protein [Streptomyces scabiei]MDX3050839.1 hypothetical protein [Streptomyces scabiei]
MSEPVRWVIPAILLVAVAGIPLSLLWEKARPSSYTARGDAVGADLSVWRGLSTDQQAAADAFALEAQESAEVDAEDAARLVVERASQANARSRP